MIQPRFFYRREGKSNGVERIFTVAYTYDCNTGQAVYGAAVFRRTSTRETFIKSQHRKTAAGRFHKCPISITVENVNHLSEVEDAIRDSIKTLGVRGARS